MADSEGFVFGCVADKELKNTTTFGFLKEIQKAFDADDSSKFKKVLKTQMARYSNEKEVNKIVAIKEELEEVKNVMRINIDKVLERGDKLSTLEEKSASLEADALGFKKRAQELHRSMWCANLRMKLLLAGIVFAIVTAVVMVIVFSTCGASLQYCQPAPAPAPSVPTSPTAPTTTGI